MNKPKVVEEYSFKRILDEMLHDFTKRYKEHHENFSYPLVSDPIYHIFATAAYREGLLRQRINEAAREGLLNFTTALDDLLSIKRIDGESYDDYKNRIKGELRAIPSGGSRAHYKNAALLYNKNIKDIYIKRGESGAVEVYLLEKNETGEPSANLLASTLEILSKDDIKMLTDTIEVYPGEAVRVGVQADIVFIPSAPSDSIDMLKVYFTDEFYKNQKLGEDITSSWIISVLQSFDPVKSVRLKVPLMDVSLLPHEFGILDNLFLTKVDK